ncbi:MAG: class I SAM-dependent methyltransferase [Pseudomonadota bacterium]
MDALYDKIGIGYAGLRKPDLRIAKLIHNGLGDTQSVLNVGAGTGSYEPSGRSLIAIEPSAEMIRQRPPSAACVVQGVAERLPFADRTFDTAMAVLTIHHWSNLKEGLLEMRRVARGPLVILTFDPNASYFWLKDYLPEIVLIDQPIMPQMDAYEQILGEVAITTVPIPHDCTDGFLGAYWRRPHAYHNPLVRSAISTFSKIDDPTPSLQRLEEDLQSGAWEERYGALMGEQKLDIGYRLVVAEAN